MKSAAAPKKDGGFDPDIFLATIGDGRKILAVPKKQLIFAQGTARMLSSISKKAK